MTKNNNLCCSAEQLKYQIKRGMKIDLLKQIKTIERHFIKQKFVKRHTLVYVRAHFFFLYISLFHHCFIVCAQYISIFQAEKATKPNQAILFDCIWSTFAGWQQSETLFFLLWEREREKNGANLYACISLYFPVDADVDADVDVIQF